MYIGNTPTQQAFTPAVDVFSGNGSTTAFTLSRSVASVAQVEAVVENVPQSPVDAFTVNGTTITFTSAPPSGSSNIYVRYTSPITQTAQPGQGTVGTIQLADAGVTPAKLANSGAELGMRNRIINGNMVIDQRNAGASVTLTSSNAYNLDRWYARAATGSGTTAIQSTTVPSNYKNSLLITVGTGASPGSTDNNYIAQRIEGLNMADFGWGTATASTVTLSFWVRSSLTGTFGGAIQNSDVTRSYPFTYTISAANTWEQKSVTIVGDTSGTWLTTTGIGMTMTFDLGTGSTYQGPANTWASADYRAASGATKVIATSGATFYVTGVQLEKGSTATPFENRLYGTELSLCQRYYTVNTYVPYTAAYPPLTVPFKVSMRTIPTLAGGGAGFTATALNSDLQQMYQTTPASQTITATAEL